MNKFSDFLKNLPDLSGSYQFFDNKNEIIYVGKAKNLKKRVSSYFNKKHVDAKTQILVSKVEKIEFIITDNEIEALILESHLIKKYKPKYNILLKDDKKFPYFVITNEDYPRILVARKGNKNRLKGKYFGPYTNSRAMYSTLELLKKMFPLKQCKTPKFKTRPCIYYSIGKCLAPCQGLISSENYKQIIKNVELFLSGHQSKILKSLKSEMHRLSDNQEYEKASKFRDSYFDVMKTLEQQKVVSENTKLNQDIIASKTYNKLGVVCLLQIREGRLINKKDFEFETVDFNDEFELVETFFKEYYSLLSKNEFPAEIILSIDFDDKKLYEEWLKLKAQKTIKIKIAKSKKDIEISELANKNAQTFFERIKIEKAVSLQNDYNEIGNYIKEKLELNVFPHRVECFDISHIQGTNTVASCVVFENGKPLKSQYRKFKLRTTQGKSDDFKSLQEVIKRRYSKVKLPDLIIIDGGKGQLSSVLKAFKEINVTPENIVSLAKKLEEVFLPNKSKPIILPNSPVLFFFQQIRDEAHRFAITYHRKLREKIF